MKLYNIFKAHLIELGGYCHIRKYDIRKLAFVFWSPAYKYWIDWLDHNNQDTPFQTTKIDIEELEREYQKTKKIKPKFIKYL